MRAKQGRSRLLRYTVYLIQGLSEAHKHICQPPLNDSVPAEVHQRTIEKIDGVHRHDWIRGIKDFFKYMLLLLVSQFIPPVHFLQEGLHSPTHGLSGGARRMALTSLGFASWWFSTAFLILPSFVPETGEPVDPANACDPRRIIKAHA